MEEITVLFDLVSQCSDGNFSWEELVDKFNDWGSKNGKPHRTSRSLKVSVPFLFC